MKNLKKILALVLVAMMVLSLSVTSFAADGDEPTTGTIIIQNATKGHTYTAYKVFDATYSGDAVSYKTDADNASLLDDTLFGWSAPDANDKISVWALEDADESDIIDWMKANYAAFGGAAITGTFDATNSTVTFSDLDFGYYYITSSLGSSVTITTAAPSAEVYDKNFVEPTDPVKTIIAVDGEEQGEVTEANAHVGSVVTFQVTAKTVNWTGEKTADGSIEEVTEATITEEWKLIDTPTNMEIDPDSIVVNFNGEDLDEDAYTASVGTDGKLTINVPMVDDNGNSIYEAPEDGLIPIVVTYDATITAAAADEPAENEVGGPPVLVYTYAFQIEKVDEDDEPLPGAQFELWADGAALTFIDNGDGTYTYSPDGTVTTLDMTTNTTIVVKGLDNSWTYTLKEITVPEGYNQAADITVAGSDLTKVEEDTDTTINSTELFKETVVNKAGVELPSTGGIGTTLFYVIGSILVLGAGVVLVAKKRAID